MSWSRWRGWSGDETGSATSGNAGEATAGDCGRNPLRRPIDDIEAAIITCLIIFFVLACPLLCVVTGRIADSSAVAERHAEQSWQPVTAVLNESAAAGLVGLDGEWGASWVTAHWTLRDGRTATGLLAVDLNARQGQHLAIWVSATGQVTHPPLSQAEIDDRVASAALATAAGLGLLLAIVVVAVRVIAGRRRMAAWERSWEAIAPRWSPRP